MSIVGRRGSRGPGWTWSRQPSGPRRPPPSLPLLPLAGAGLIALFVALALLGVWLSDRDDNSPAGTSGTPTATPAVTATPSPTVTPAVTATPSPTATPAVTTTPSPTTTPGPTRSPTPSPSPVPTPASPTPDGQEPLLRLAAWDGERWRFEERLEGAAFRTGEAVPFLFRIDRASRVPGYPLTIIYDCKAFSFLTDYERDQGSRPALASHGPQSAAPDSTLLIPDDEGTRADDTEGGSLSLWGGLFGTAGVPLPRSPCADEKSLSISLVPAADTLYLMWAAELSGAALDGGVPLRLSVRIFPGPEEITIEIDPDSVGPAQP